MIMLSVHALLLQLKKIVQFKIISIYLKRHYIFETMYYFVWKYWFTLIVLFLQKYSWNLSDLTNYETNKGKY